MLTKTVILNIILFCASLSLVSGLTSTTPKQNPLFDIRELNCTLGQTSESPLCNWTSLNNTHWSRGETGHCFKSVNLTGPAGPPTFNGHYIRAAKPQKGNYFPFADLTSPILKPKETTDCFSFNYYIDGNGVKELRLTLVKHTDVGNKSENIWNRHYSAGDFWHSSRVAIEPQKTNYLLEFAAITDSGEIALGNLQVTPGICPDHSCDFESGFCNWTTTYTNKSYQFQLVEASDGTWNGPAQDHTTDNAYGHLIRVDEGHIGDSTSLISPEINFTEKHCFQFWYFSTNNHANIIEVLNHGLNAISNVNAANKTWLRAQVNLNVTGETQIVIRTTKQNNQLSALVIDDISLIKGDCQEPISCNFNKDLCGWTRDMSLDWIWDQGIGRVENATIIEDLIELAPEDRTDPSYGMYLYTDFTLLRQNERMGIMKIQSDFVQATKGSCLSFYLMPVSFNDTTAGFHIILYDVQGNTIKTPFNYSSKNNPDSNHFLQWTKISVDISVTSSFRIVIEVNSKVPSTYVAIDDIEHKAGVCGHSTTSKPITMTTAK